MLPRMPLDSNESSDSLPAFPPGRFTFDGPVGIGNHGQVMRALDRQLRRQVAIKLSLDPAAFQRVAAAELDDLEIEAQLREATAALAARPGALPRSSRRRRLGLRRTGSSSVISTPRSACCCMVISTRRRRDRTIT